MFKIVITFVALAAFQGVCGVPIPEHGIEAAPVPDFLSRLLGSLPTVELEAPVKRQISEEPLLSLLEDDTLLKRDISSGEFDIGSLLGGWWGNTPSGGGQVSPGGLLRRLSDYTDDALLNRDIASGEFDIGGLLGSLFGNNAPGSGQSSLGKVLKRSPEGITDDDSDSSDVLRKRQLPNILKGLPLGLSPASLNKIKLALANLKSASPSKRQI